MICFPERLSFTLYLNLQLIELDDCVKLASLITYKCATNILYLNLPNGNYRTFICKNIYWWQVEGLW